MEKASKTNVPIRDWQKWRASLFEKSVRLPPSRQYVESLGTESARPGQQHVFEPKLESLMIKPLDRERCDSDFWLSYLVQHKLESCSSLKCVSLKALRLNDWSGLAEFMVQKGVQALELICCDFVSKTALQTLCWLSSHLLFLSMSNTHSARLKAKEFFARAMTMLAQNTSLLYFEPPHDFGNENLREFLANNPNLQEIRCSNRLIPQCPVPSTDDPTIASNSLHRSPSVASRHLSLTIRDSWEDFIQAGAGFSQFLKQAGRLRSLCLVNGGFSQRLVDTTLDHLTTDRLELTIWRHINTTSLGRLITEGRVKELVLNTNRLDGNGIVELVQTARGDLSNLELLSVERNGIGWLGLEALAASSGPRSVRLKNVEESELKRDGAWSSFAESLAGNTKLEKLSIESRSSKLALAFLQSISRIGSLRELRLGCVVDPTDVEVLPDLLLHQVKQNLQLIELIFYSSRLDGQLVTDEIRHYLELNKAGRRLLSQKVDPPAGLWAEILGRQSCTKNAMFYFLKEKPDLVLGACQTKQKRKLSDVSISDHRPCKRR